MRNSSIHLKFPFQVRRGAVERASNDEWVLGLIEQVLFTMAGERVNRPQFGCGVELLVFEPNSAQLASATEYLIVAELQRWLTGIADVKGVAVRATGATLAIDIDYVNLLTGQPNQATLSRAR